MIVQGRSVSKGRDPPHHMLSRRRSMTAATKFSAPTLEVNGVPRQDRHPQERCQHGRHHRDKPHVETVRLPDIDQDGADQIPQHNRRAGPPPHQERDQADARLQILLCSFSDFGSYRGREHDPQASVDAQTLPVCSIRGAGCMAKRRQNSCSTKA